MIDQHRLRRLSVILFFLSLVMLVIHLETLVRFNRREIHVQGNNSSDVVGMAIDARAGSTSTWLKRSFVLDDGREVDLIGQTIDGTLRNGSRETLKDWELRINIVGDCYINQAWNGEVEIHQFVGTEKETVQRMNLQDYRLEDVTFEHRYDGDLLIPLQKGDYVIYYPSTRFSEMPIYGGGDAKIGVIFYYVDALDLSDYELVFHFHRSFSQGFTFYAAAALFGLWTLTMTVSGASTLAYRRAMKEMELRKSGIFSMSDIYDLIYLIHLPTGEMTPVSVDEKVERARPKNRTAKEMLTDMVMRDAEDRFQERMLEFVDTDTLAERLKDRNSVAIEFASRQYGWCEIRFCAMDRVKGSTVENVVFAVQNINDEKKEQEAVVQQIEAAQSASESKAVLVDSIADGLQKPLQGLAALNDRILRESGEEAVKGYARSARSTARRLLVLADGLVDGFAVETGGLQPAAEVYSLRQVLTDTLQIILPLAEENRCALSLDAAEALPDQLRGDARMLREVLVNLMSSSLFQAEGGSLQLAVYGKPLDDRIHLLFSVRGLSNPEAVRTDPGLSNEVVNALLTGMGSALRTVKSPAGHSEVYFELEQPVLYASPIGKIAVEE